MSDTVTTESGTADPHDPGVDAHVTDADHDEVAHQSDGFYVRIAIVLAVITAVEVAWSYLGLPTFAEVGGLLAMMALKFFLVAAHFMHLKFDNKVLTQLFYGGLALAVGVYVVALLTFQVF